VLTAGRPAGPCQVLPLRDGQRVSL